MRGLVLVLVCLVVSGCAVHVQDHPWLLCRFSTDRSLIACKPIPAPKETPPDPASRQVPGPRGWDGWAWVS